MDDESEIKPPADLGDNENGNISHRSVSELISSLKSSFRAKDFEKVEAVLLAREEKSKLEIKRLKEGNESLSYKFEEQRLEKMGLADNLRKCMKELEEMRNEVSKLREEKMVLSGKEKFAEEKCKRLSEEVESLREKAHENIELMRKNWELECAKAKAESEAETLRLRHTELDNRVLRLERGFTLLSDQVDPKNNNEIGGEIENSENARVKPVETMNVEERSNVPSDSPVKCNGQSQNAGSRGLPSQNVVEIVVIDSDDDCAPAENLSEKRTIRPTEKSPSAQICVENGTAAIKQNLTSSIDVGEGENGDNDALSEKLKRTIRNGTAAIKRKQTSSIDVGEGENGDNDAFSEKLKRTIRPTENSPSAHVCMENGTAAIKRKQTSSVDVGEGENGDNDAISEKVKMRKLQEPISRPDDCPLNHCSNPRKDFMVSGQREQQAESEQRSQGIMSGFPLDGLRLSEESSVSSDSESDDESDEEHISLNLSQLASETRRES